MIPEGGNARAAKRGESLGTINFLPHLETDHESTRCLSAMLPSSKRTSNKQCWTCLVMLRSPSFRVSNHGPRCRI